MLSSTLDAPDSSLAGQHLLPSPSSSSQASEAKVAFAVGDAHPARLFDRELVSVHPTSEKASCTLKISSANSAPRGSPPGKLQNTQDEDSYHGFGIIIARIRYRYNVLAC